jgi:phytanoyl-CoA hydroxylase
MKTALTQAQVDQYNRDGFIHIPGFLTPAQVAELKQAVLEAVAQMGSRLISDQTREVAKDDGHYNKVFTQKLNLWKIHPVAKRYMLSPDLGVMIARLSGVSRQRMWHDQTLIKEPFGNATAWHLDNPYWSFTSPNAISIWIALEDATPNNGNLSFIPGSHKMAKFDPAIGRYKGPGIGMNMDELFKVYPEMAAIEPVHVPMKAGDCSFHNGLTAHGANANMTRGRRIAMTAGFMPDGSTFNGHKNIMPDWYFNSLKIGDTLDNNDLNPLV